LKRWSLVCLLGVTLLTGCATGNADDDAFFNHGWIWPKSMDRPKEAPPLSDDSTLGEPM